ncbi:MAG: hypothetical protein AABZ55_00620, partial [Bdellovibrionota bacterium]
GATAVDFMRKQQEAQLVARPTQVAVPQQYAGVEPTPVEVAAVPPPLPSAQRLAEAGAVAAGLAIPVTSANTLVQAQMSFDDATEMLSEELPKDAMTAAQLSSSLIVGAQAAIRPENGELARARAIAQRLGITNLTDDEYDVPTYMRRQKEREI